MEKRILSLLVALSLIICTVPVYTTSVLAATPTVYSQLSEPWGSHGYGYSNTGGTVPATIASGGCGILALVNAVYYMNDCFINPITLADYSVDNGYRVNGIGTAHALYPSYSNSNGNTYGFECKSSEGTTSISTLKGHIQQGGVAIAPSTTVATGGGHIMAVVDYNSSSDTFLVLDSYVSSNRFSSSFSWQTINASSMTTGNGKVRFSKFILIYSKSSTHTHMYTGLYYEDAHPHLEYRKCSCGAIQYTGNTGTSASCSICNPVSTTTKYSTVLSFRGYLNGSSKVTTYTTANLAESTGEIWTTDECTISKTYTNGACEVTYPVGSTTKKAYTQLTNFIGNTSANLTAQTLGHQVTTYIRASTGSTKYGYISSGDKIYKLGTSGSMTQVFYPTSSGYKLAWVVTSDLTEPTFDTVFNPYCPIKGYIVGDSTIPTYESNYSTVAGEIWTSDYCTIDAVYANGWVKVTYPAGSGTKTKYVQLTSFVSSPYSVHTQYTANTQIDTYARPSAVGGTRIGWISSGDIFYVVSTSGTKSEVFYPIDAQYGGGYKLGWISTSNLPNYTYTVSYNANGGTGAPSSQTKTHGVNLTLRTTTPTRTGYSFVGWATSSSATSAAYAAGATYLVNANLTLYAVWSVNKYSVTFNANGGSNAPSSQTKTHGVNLVLSNSKPVRYFTVTYNPNGGSVPTASESLACSFLGWSVNSTATTATYSAGGTFSTEANTTLYAVWQPPALTAYPIPTRNGYVFAGWFTSASGGTQFMSSTSITANTTVYAHWDISAYEVLYDANGGLGAPEAQTKMNGTPLVLSSALPTRVGFVFLGWGTTPEATVKEYEPNGIYDKNSEIVLYAIWETISLNGISVATEPNVIQYDLGDELDTTGMTLTATYSDDSTETITSGFTCTPTTLVTAGTQIITVSYGGKSTEFTVTVEEPNINAAKFVVSSPKANVGQTVTVTVSVENNPGIIAARLSIGYDATKLQLTGVANSGLIGGTFTAGNDILANPYTVLWEDGLSSINYTGNGVMATYTFLVLENAALGVTPIIVSYDQGSTFNCDMEDVEFALENGSIEITDRTPGDANDDGLINLKDVAVIRRYLAGGWDVTINSANADVNADGEVNLKDVVLINRFLAGGWGVILV